MLALTGCRFQDLTPGGGLGARQSLELAHEEGVGKPVKAESLNAFGVEPPRDGQKLGHPRHVPVEGGIEARHLWQSRMTLMKDLH